MTNQIATLLARFGALADPTRSAMIMRLASGPAAVSDLAAPFGMALPTILQHLQVLEKAGLVRSEKLGRVRMVQLEPDALRATGDWLAQQAAVWEARLDRMDALALTLDTEMCDD